MATTRRSSTRRAWTAAALVLAALIGAAVWGLLTYQDLQERLDALPRTTVPGEVTVDVTDAHGLTVFYEDPEAPTGFVVRSSQTTTISSSPVDLSVLGPSGPVTLTRYDRDLRFDVDDRVATALMTFDAPEPGRYTLRATGDVPAGSMVSVGDVVDGGLLASTAGAIGLFVASIVAGAVIVVLSLAGPTGTPARPARVPGRDGERDRTGAPS